MEIELSNNDLREIKTAVRDRADALKKEADRLVSLGRGAEADNLLDTSDDLKERLCTHITEALGVEG